VTGGVTSLGASAPGGAFLAGGAGAKGGSVMFGGAATSGGTMTSGGTATTGGTPTTGGIATTGGTGGAAAECTTATDCELIDDCCFCAAHGKATPSPVCLMQECKKNQCGSPQPTPACVGGQCVLDVSCDATQVSCPAVPACPPGMIPTVVANCWGWCVDPTQCPSVTTCRDCGDYPCAQLDFMSGRVTRCIRTPAVCTDSPNCSCLGHAVCGSYPGMLCGDVSPGVLGCYCPSC
jgi:hypothetical protein